MSENKENLSDPLESKEGLGVDKLLKALEEEVVENGNLLTAEQKEKLQQIIDYSKLSEQKDALPPEVEEKISEIIEMFNEIQGLKQTLRNLAPSKNLLELQQKCDELFTKFNTEFNHNRVGTINAMERRRDSSTPPIFKEDTAGDYYCYQIGNNNYILTPGFDLTYQQIYHEQGAGTELFDALEPFDPKKRYRNYKVIKPTIATKVGGEIKIQKKGLLDLGKGEEYNY